MDAVVIILPFFRRFVFRGAFNADRLFCALCFLVGAVYLPQGLRALPLEGVVVDDEHKPLNGAVVELISDIPHYWTESDLTAIGRTTTKPDGSFKLDAASSGAIALLAYAAE